MRARMIIVWSLALCLSVFFVVNHSSQSSELKELDFLDDYSVKSDDIEHQLEKYRIERDVALTAIGHPSLTAIPKHDPLWKRQQLKRLKEQAIEKLERISRGRHTYTMGLADDDDDFSGTTTSTDEDINKSCSEDDARLGLCGVQISNPGDQQLKDQEALVSKQLDEKEAKSDAERNSIMMEINKQRLIKAKKLMKDLVDTDKRINELVHHAVKVAAMAPHTPAA